MNSNLLKYSRQVIPRIIHYRKFVKEFIPFLPEEFRAAAYFLFVPKPSFNELILSTKIEKFRSLITSISREKKISSYQSPHSGTFRKDEQGHAISGDLLDSDVEAHLKTGISKFKGILLRKIIEGFGAKKVLELGTNTGFSGSYCLSINGVHLVTIEGSKALCDIADQNMKRISSNYRIMHNLFDNAIDELVEENVKFDAVFVDGQHEKEATLHYARRLKPLMAERLMYIFDDIYWSEDMNQGWNELVISGDYAQVIDLFLFGICVQDKARADQTEFYDLGDYLPRPEYSKKEW